MSIRRTFKVAGLLAVVAGSLLVSGCVGIVRAGELHTESRSVALDGAESVRAEIDVDSGDLQVSGGAQENLLAARFTSNVASGKPQIDYDLSGDRGTLKVWQPETTRPNINIGSVRREWDLRLNDRVALDELTMRTGVGDADVNLASLSPSKLKVESDTGDLNVDLAGEWKRDLEATIETDVGEIGVMLPSDIGVHVDVDTGVGSVNTTGLLKDSGVHGTNAYVNDGFGKSKRELRIRVNSNVGDVDLEVGR
jgi:outer membrane murein-binding lipoprotein Lpp